MKYSYMDKPGRRPIWRLIRPHRGRVLALSSVSFVGGLAEAAFLVVITRTALAVAAGKHEVGVLAGWFQSVGTALAISAGLVVLRLLLALGAGWLSVDLSLTVSTGVRRDLSRAFLHASWEVQQGERSGRLQELMGSYSGAVSGTVTSLVGGIVAGVNLAALIGASLVVDPMSTLVVLGALTVLGSGLAPLRRRIRAQSQIAASAGLDYATSVAELGSLGLEMQVFGARDAFVERIDRLIAVALRAYRRASLLQAAIGPVYNALAYLAILGGLAVAAWVGVHELSTVGAVLLVMMRSLSYGQNLQSSMANVAGNVPFLEVVEETMAHYAVNRATGGAALVEHAGDLRADNVSFEYSPGIDVLRGLSFTIRVGEVVGIVGPSGSGKTTLVQLLLGLRNPTSGTMRIGDVDLTDVDRAAWTSRVAFVPQDALLFAGSVADNIRFFRTGLSDEDVESAGRKANLHDDIIAMEGGYHESVGERGARLSGGQRQRLSIARALAGRPEVLILDEPTSALDVRSESLIRETLAELAGEVTIIVIAHRLSTLDVCDRIMVIQDGTMRGFDAPDVLATTDPFYREALELSGLL